jgi:hypothetical protein
MQIIQIFMMSVGDVFLGSIPGCIADIFVGTHHILCYKNKLNIPVKIILIILLITVSLITNNIGWFVIFPILSFVMLIVFMNTSNIVRFKIILIVDNILWMIHDLYIGAFVPVIFDVLGIILSIIGIYRVKKSSCSISTITH